MHVTWTEICDVGLQVAVRDLIWKVGFFSSISLDYGNGNGLEIFVLKNLVQDFNKNLAQNALNSAPKMQGLSAATWPF